MSEFDPGSVIDGRYRVLSRVGAGGMADVYLAEDEQLSREVALKLLHRRFAEDPGFVERFRREAQAAASLQHPNVVSVFDRGEFGGTYYIAMEYLPGRSLKQLIREEAPLEPGRAVDLTIQILKAARFAHRRGVIHRDLKPHNVIVDDNDHAKVTDFGIARAGASDMTETGSIMGTAQYLSPEQAQGHAVSAPSDLYSVAIVLYEMLTGRVPFDGDSAVTIALKHVSEPPVPPSQLNPAVSPALDQVVMWALNKDAADRPADADQFITALEQVRGAVTGPVGEITASMRTVTAGGALVPYGGGVASGDTGVYPRTAVIPASDALGMYGTSQNMQVSGERLNRYDDDQDDKRGKPIWPWLLGVVIVLLIGGGIAAYALTRPKEVTTPYVVGLSLSNAQTKVQNANLTWNVANERSRSVPAGEIISQDPAYGTKQKQGSVVTLFVSSGVGSVQVPTVVTLTVSQARTALARAGLIVARVTNSLSSNIPKGQAIGTTPDAGTTVQRGTPVTLAISSGLAVTVPAVTGIPYNQAQVELQGFKVTTVQQTSTTQQPGTVITQVPAATTTVASNSPVTLTIAEAPKTATVPDVIGDTEGGGSQTLSGAGFKVFERYVTVNNPSQVGEVVNQYPAPNATAKKDTTVTIVIGKAGKHTYTNTNTNTSTTRTNTGTTRTNTNTNANTTTTATNTNTTTTSTGQSTTTTGS